MGNYFNYFPHMLKAARLLRLEGILCMKECFLCVFPFRYTESYKFSVNTIVHYNMRAVCPALIYLSRVYGGYFTSIEN